MDPLGVSIVICCHNSSYRLPKTIAHLKDQKVPRELLWEVIIVDNASTDGTGEKAQLIWGDKTYPPFKVVVESKPGLMHARLKGFESSNYEFISFVDDDNWLSEDWVKTVYEKMVKYPDAGAIGGQSKAVFETKPPRWFNQYQGWYAVGKPLGINGKHLEIECQMPDGKFLWGAGLTIRRSAWQDILERGFKPILTGRRGKKISSGEDLEICAALVLAGWKLIYTPDLELIHYMTSNRLTWKYVSKLYRANGQCHLYLDHYLRYMDSKTINLTEDVDWFTGLYNEARYIIKRPRRLIDAILFIREEDPLILKMQKSIGALLERLRTLGKLDFYKDEIEKQVEKLKY